MIFGNMGKASTTRPHNLQISTQRDNFQSTSTSTPRTPLTTSSGERISEHLHAELLEWMQGRNVSLGAPNGDFLTP
jgi:hypothetical protein